MRRDLSSPHRTEDGPSSLSLAALSVENAGEAHRLLALGTELGGGRVPDFEPWLRGFEDDPEFDRHLCFLVGDAAGLVAVAHCWTSAFIRNLVVHPRAQGRGIGLALLGQVFETFAERRERHVDLKVRESNLTARRLYERAGMHYVQRCELEPR
ncbi:GNAT family N-acetyltransferase [Pseudomonas sp. LP_7_YM]|uniref:GNAT family N-acetyltransferase n=1 Tax=Pseudomonas sp. LP_7_YM TaxID=2485137 RepID=UPI001060967F